jgi:hypothetical protein
MPVADDWFIDYTNERFYHIDGRLSYQNNTGTAPSFGDYVVGLTSGAVSKVVAGSDLGGTTATGSIDVTETRGVWASGEEIRVLSTVDFDTVANGGFKVGDTITGPTTESIDVQAIEYNWNTAQGGRGLIFGDNLVTGFADNEQLDVSGGATAVALVAAGGETDNSGLFTGADVTTNLTVPGTADTNDSIIVHYDAGVFAIPVNSRISDTTTGAIGTVAEVYGDITTGSVRLVNSDVTAGAWTDNNNIDMEGILNWDNPTAGEVFQVGDIIQGSVSGTQARVLAIIDDGDSTGAVITANETGAGWDAATPDLIQIVRRGGLPVTTTTIAEVENTVFTRTAATLNLPNGVFSFQRADQGGIYPAAENSINIVRNSNELFTFITGEFDDLAQLDDDYPVRGDVQDQVYVLQGGWQIGDRSFNFLDSGSWADETNDNVWSNDQSIMAAKNIGTHGFLYDASNPTPQPDLYCVQNGKLLSQFWLEGEINVLIRTRTNHDPEIIDPTVDGLGQDVDGGNRTWNLRPFLSTYDYFTASTIGSVNTIPLNNANDGNNNTGTHQYTYNTGTGTPFTIGEIIQGGTSGARGIIVTSDSAATGTITYVLLTPTSFTDSETVTGDVSGATAVLDAAGGSTVVAGYNDAARVMVISSQLTGGTTSGTFINGEGVTQATTAATGFFIHEEPTNTLFIEEDTGTWNGTDAITGDTSGATYTPTTRTLDVDFEYDIGDGLGTDTYSGMVSGNRLGATAKTATEVYEWTKWITAETATPTIYAFKTRGVGNGATTVAGRIFNQLFSAAGLLKSAGGPTAQKPGAVIIGARGWVFDKNTLDSADIRNVQLFANDGTQHDAPNLQNIQWTGLVSGDAVGAYRATGVAGGGSSAILRTEFDVGTVGSGNNQAADSTILVGANTRSVSPLPVDVPDVGVLRIEDPSNPGIYLRFPYSSVDRTTNIFTLTSGTIGDVTGAVDLVLDDNVHVVYIEKVAASATESNSIQYSADFPVVMIHRLKGLKPQRTAADFTSTGVSVGAARDADPVVNLP